MFATTHAHHRVPVIMLLAAAAQLALPDGATARQDRAPAAGQAQACPRGSEPIAHFGLVTLDCPGGCTLHWAGADSPAYAEFRAEPRVATMDPYFTRSHGIRDGDVIVAVDGHLITTREGGRRWAALAPGETVTLRIRRGDRELDAAVTPVRTCGPLGVPSPAAPGTFLIPYPADVATARVYPSLRPVMPGAATPRGTLRFVPMPADSATAAQRAALAAAHQAGVARLREAEAVTAARTAGTYVERGALRPTPAPASTGWLGIALECDDCGFVYDDGRARWNFPRPPSLRSVEPGSPAARAGMRPADVLRSVDGQDITSAAGGVAFTRVEPGQSVSIGYERDGITRSARLTAEIRPSLQRDVMRELRSATTARGGILDSPADQPLRYSGAVGNARIEVRAAGGVMVTETVPGEEIEILVNGALVRVRIAR